MESGSSTDPELRSRIHQQEVVSELGQQALVSENLDQLLRDATSAIADTLDTEYCHALELVPEKNELLLRQGVGWHEGTVGSETVPTNTESQAGYTLLSQEPIIAEDLPTEDRFVRNDLLVDHDVVSGITVIIGSPEEPLGVLGTFTTDRREFTEHDVTFVLNIANILASAIENEQALTELEEIYGRISDAFFALDVEWRFTYLNQRAHEWINPDSRELEGEYVWDEFTEATERQFKPKYERAMYQQVTVSFEEYYPEPLDAWFEVSAYPSETGLSVYFRDITERKERERRLQESEQRYRTLAEYFPNGIVTLFDDDQQYTLAAGRAFDELPVSRPEVEGRRPREVWGDGVAETLEPALRAALDGDERSVEVEYGGREWIVHAVPVSGDEGEVFAGMTMAQDITERKRYQAELERALDLLEKTERIADVGGWEIDEDTQDVFWTDHIFELLEVDSAEEPPLGQALDMYHDADQAIIEDAVETALNTGESFDVEGRIVTETGEVRWLRLQGAPEMVDGDVVAVRGAAQDVTSANGASSASRSWSTGSRRRTNAWNSSPTQPPTTSRSRCGWSRVTSG